EDASDDRRLAAPEVALRDDGVGDVAAAAAAHEDLGAGPPRRVQYDDLARGRCASREDPGRQTRGAGADDDDVGGSGEGGHRPSLRIPIMTAYTAAVSLFFQD